LRDNAIVGEPTECMSVPARRITLRKIRAWIDWMTFSVELSQAIPESAFAVLEMNSAFWRHIFVSGGTEDYGGPVIALSCPEVGDIRSKDPLPKCGSDE
jgi:hypothetical protein